MKKSNSVVCICDTHEHAQSARKSLQMAGIDTQTLSFATRDASADEHVLTDYTLGDQTFTLPGFGPLLVSGPLALWIVTALKDGAGAGGVSVVGAGLAKVGIARNSILQYEAALKAGKYLLVLHGSPNEVAKAVAIIGGTTHCSHTVHGETVFDTVHGIPLQTSSAFISSALSAPRA